MKLYIKNMVCPRCVMAVDDIFRQHHLTPQSVELGYVVVPEDHLPVERVQALQQALEEKGFELIEEGKGRLVEQMKAVVIRRIFQSERLDEKINWSQIVSDECFHAYGHLSAVFSAETGSTLEQFIIRQKVERIKELLSYQELSLTEIADKLGYSSVAHLSAQFKKVSGLTPSAFRKLGPGSERKSIDSLI